MRLVSLKELNSLPLLISDGFPLARYRLVFEPVEFKLAGAIYREGKKQYGVALEDMALTTEGWKVSGPSALTEFDPAHKVWKAAERNCPLLGESVYTEDEFYLGEVVDAAFDAEQFQLIEFLTTSRSLIRRERIVRVTPEKIVVRDNRSRVNNQSKARALSARARLALPS